MQKILCFVSVIILSGLVGVDSLQCYICENCPNPTDEDLKTCGDPETTVAPPETTLAPSETTVLPPGTTLASPATTAVPPETTVVQPGTTVVPLETTVVPPGTTVASPATTAVPPETTVVSPETVAAGPQGSRTKRSVLSPLKRSDSDGCKCTNEAGCDCDNKLYSDRITLYQDIEYVCYKAEDHGTIYRGCIASSIGCDLEEARNVTSCSTCDSDKCNGSHTIEYSAFLLVAMLMHSLLLVK